MKHFHVLRACSDLTLSAAIAKPEQALSFSMGKQTHVWVTFAIMILSNVFLFSQSVGENRQHDSEHICTPPLAVCKTAPVAIDLLEGSVTISVDDIDDGSTADCGLQSLRVSPETFDCSDIDVPKQVTLTITDNNGDFDTCMTLVEVTDIAAPVITLGDITMGLDTVRKIIRDDHKYNGFPTLLKTNKGTFIGTYRVGTSHFADGSISVFRSRNLLGIETQVLHQNPDTSGMHVGWYETILAEFSPDTIHAISSYSMPDSTITAVKISVDDGETWSTVDTIPHFYSSKKQRFGPSKGINRDGRWIFPIYGIKGIGNTSYTAGILYSEDRGTSWTLSEFSQDTLIKLDESSLVAVKDTLIAFVRSEQTDEERLYRTYSVDKGSSWSTPIRIELEKWRRSHPSTILLPNGNILLEGRNFAETGGIERRRPVIWQSSDNGRTFERIDILDIQGYGMYSSFELIGDNKVALLYGIEDRFEPPPITSDVKLAVFDIPVLLENQYYACVSQVPAANTLTAVDNCAGYITAISSELDNATTGCAGDPLIITRMWTFEDGAGNFDTVSQFIQVESDDTPPTLVCINGTVQLPTEEAYALSVADVVNLDSSYANCSDLSIVSISPSLLTCDMLGSPVNVTVTGIDECGREASCTSFITVEEAHTPLPIPWESAVSSGWEGEASFERCDNEGAFTLSTNAWQHPLDSDNHQYVYQSKCNEISIKAQIMQFAPNGWQGLFIRNGIEADNAGLFFQLGAKSESVPDDRAHLKFRQTDGGALQSHQLSTLVSPYWMRLVSAPAFNTGRWVELSVSLDGETWTTVALRTIEGLMDCIEVGLAVQSKQFGQEVTAKFTNVSMSTDGLNISLKKNSEEATQFESIKPKQFNLSPNPARNWLQLTLTEPLEANLTYSLWNSMGQLVQKGLLMAGDSSVEINTAELAAGLYTIHLHTSTVHYPSSPTGATNQKVLRFIKH